MGIDRDARLRMWLRAQRGDETQERLAADIEAVTGWRLTRDRYSKYESGSLPIGLKVKGHFVDYWTSRGRTGPDAFAPPVSPGDATTATPGLADLTAAISRLAEQLDADRQERQQARRELYDRLARLEDVQGQWARLDERTAENRRRIDEMAATLTRLAAAALHGPGTEGNPEPTVPQRTGG